MYKCGHERYNPFFSYHWIAKPTRESVYFKLLRTTEGLASPDNCCVNSRFIDGAAMINQSVTQILFAALQAFSFDSHDLVLLL